MTEICILTFVLQAHHCVILEDWLDFFDHPVKKIVVHVGTDPEILRTLEALAAGRDITLVPVGPTTPVETSQNELSLLVKQFEHVDQEDLACIVKLDTFPFRAPGKAWQDEALLAMRRHGALFITGSTLPYRADLGTTSENILLTQRVSNCFLILSKGVWFRALESSFGNQSDHGRFAPEGDFESYLASTDQYGLRVRNSPDLRIFHCHEWGARQRKIRRSFRKGKGVSRYLRGYQDDLWGPGARFYMKRPPSLAKRIRIAFGRWRRQLLWP
jgi:hypothetical protein